MKFGENCGSGGESRRLFSISRGASRNSRGGGGAKVSDSDSDDPNNSGRCTSIEATGVNWAMSGGG